MVTRFSRLSSLLIGLALLLLPGIVEAQELGKRLALNCSGANVPARDHRVVIDANTGEVLDGSVHFPELDRVQVVLTNKNPFKYRYRVSVVSTPLDVGIVHSFLGMVPGFAEVLTAMQGRSVDAPGAVPPAAAAPGCSDEARAALDRIAKATQALNEARVKLNTAFKTLGTTLERFLKATDRESIPSADCVEICNDADALQGLLPGFIDGGQAKAVAELEAAVANLEKAVASFRADFKDCATNEAAVLRAADGAAKAGAADAKTLKDALAKLTENKSTLQNVLAAIKSAGATAYPFTQPYYPRVQGEPTAVTVRIWRTNLREADPQEHEIGQVVVQLGEARASISTGIGWSAVRDRKVTRISAMVPGEEEGEQVLGSRFGYSVDAPEKPVILVLLNGHTPEWRIGRVPLFVNAVSIGAVFRAVDGGAAPVELLMGLSRRFAGGTSLVTLGLHLARPEMLAGTPEEGFFKIGDPVPSGLADLDGVIRRDWKAGALLAITFKIR